MNILVTEDNPQSLYLLEQYFAARGHTVWSAINGRDGLDLLKRSRPARCRGFRRPHANHGWLRTLHGHPTGSTLQRTAFIPYTATYTAASDEQFALSIGVDRFVVKPIESDRLPSIVEQVVTEVKARPTREVVRTPFAASQLQDYARMVLVKLEDKLLELSKANTALSSSEESVRTLNGKLGATVRRLESEIDGHHRANELLRMAQKAGGIACRESNVHSQWVRYLEACFGLDGWEGEEWKVDISIRGTMFL